MENATKALLIAGGTLIGIMILSLGMTLFAEMSSYVESSQATIRSNELNAFNTQFLKYYYADYDTNASANLAIHDVITVANLAKENNTSYNLTEASRGNKSIFYVAVYFGDDEEPIEDDNQQDLIQLLSDNNSKIFICDKVEISETTGRVYEIYFKEK